MNSIEAVCENLSSKIREIYLRKCLRYEELDVVDIESLCRENIVSGLRKRILEEISGRIAEMHSLCSKAYIELEGDLFQIERWSGFERIYILSREVNEILSSKLGIYRDLVRRVSYSNIIITILALVILILSVYPSAILIFLSLIYSLILLTPILYSQKNPQASYLILGLLLSTGFYILYIAGAEYIILVSYGFLVLSSIYLSIVVRNMLNRI
ncbi:MAG: hypothetical protein QXD76_03920 [Sulfolobales archaeon]